tara:strand:+ start:3965 stop:4849 length:885 start_codon:yes stop_codon:yes gene_type:complete
MVSDNGDHVGGAIGFLNGLRLLLEQLRPKNVIVAWEGGGSTRRRAIFPEYKNKRRPLKLNRFYEGDIPSTVENRNHQVNLLVQLLRNAGISQVYMSDCEADDTIGYLAKHYFKDENLVIISSDKDYYQLISDNILVWSPGQKRFIDNELVIRKFGIPVHNFCTVRCFCGDGSDGLPGIKGAGFRTMAKRFPSLLNDDFLSVEDILKLSVENEKSSRIKLFKEINQNANIAQRNWKLMYLDTKNLSGFQILKLEGLIDSLDPKLNKIKFLHALIKNGIRTFDADRFLMTTKLINY